MVCFWIAYKLRRIFTFLKGCKKKKKRKKRVESVTETACGPQYLKYLLCGPLQKKFATSCSLPFVFLISLVCQIFRGLWNSHTSIKLSSVYTLYCSTSQHVKVYDEHIFSVPLNAWILFCKITYCNPCYIFVCISLLCLPIFYLKTSLVTLF